MIEIKFSEQIILDNDDAPIYVRTEKGLFVFMGEKAKELNNKVSKMILEVLESEK